MIEEQFVSFDTAKMLKEAGFHIPCIKVYNKYSKKLAAWSYPADSNQHTRYYSAPTQALTARWLREKHNIDVIVIPCEDGCYVYDILHDKHRIASSIPFQGSYEGVLELGLCMAIKLIKK